MANRRVRRLNEQLKREIAQVLRTQVHDPRVTGVTVTGVEVSPDLVLARVWVWVSGEEGERERSMEGLRASASFVRRQLGAALSIRRIPELDFREDRTLEHALRIEKLLREVQQRQPCQELEEPDAEDEAEEPEE